MIPIWEFKHKKYLCTMSIQCKSYDLAKQIFEGIVSDEKHWEVVDIVKSFNEWVKS